MMKYSHIGVPTTQDKNWTGYIPELGVHCTDPKTDLYAVEWLKFDSDSPLDEAIRTQIHVAFLVDSLDAALVGKKVLLAPMSPMPGLKIAFIDHDGTVVELCQEIP